MILKHAGCTNVSNVFAEDRTRVVKSSVRLCTAQHSERSNCFGHNGATAEAGNLRGNYRSPRIADFLCSPLQANRGSGSSSFRYKQATMVGTVGGCIVSATENRLLTALGAPSGVSLLIYRVNQAGYIYKVTLDCTRVPPLLTHTPPLATAIIIKDVGIS